MIRRTFLSTISALAVAPFGWLWRRSAAPAQGGDDLLVSMGDQSMPGGIKIQWRKGSKRPIVSEKDTARPLRLIERTDAGWFTYRNEYAGIRFRVDPESDRAVAWIDYVYWSDRPWCFLPAPGHVVTYNILRPEGFYA